MNQTEECKCPIVAFRSAKGCYFVVAWPSGLVESRTNLPVDQILDLNEGDAGPALVPNPRSASVRSPR